MIGLTPEQIDEICNIAGTITSIDKVILFGSRAMGTFSASSDVDLALVGDKVTLKEQLHINARLNESKSLLKYDVVRFSTIKNDKLIEHIIKYGVVVYERSATKEGFRKIIEKQAVIIRSSQSSFSEMRLGDTCVKIGSGATPRGGNSVYLNTGDISLIRSQNIYNDGFHRDGLAFISQEHADQLRNVEVKEGDVLLNITGDSVARCCQVAPDALPARVNQHVAIIRPDEKKLLSRFLRYYMISPSTQNKLLSMAAAGATRPALTKGMIEDLKILAPDTTTQHAIAHILGTLDDKIELNRKMNQTLEEIARTLYKSWFVDFDPVKKKAAGEPTGLPEEIDKLFPDEFEESEFGKIPKGWRVATINELFTIIGGGTPKTSVIDYWNGDIPWFSVVDTPKNSDIFVIDTEKKITQAGINNSSTNLLEIGTTIITARGTVGNIALVGKPMAMNQSCYALKTKLPETDYFGYFTVSNAILQIKQKTHGSVFDTITRETLSSINIISPECMVAQTYHKTVGASLSSILTNVENTLLLGNIRDILLPILLSGKLPIKDAEKFLAEAGL